MGRTSTIEWTDATWNPIHGCTKVSPACTNCYAAAAAMRNPATLGVWGPQGTRVKAVESSWGDVFKWDREAAKAGRRLKVFCESIGDIFEAWDGPVLDHKGNRLFTYVDDNASAVDGSVGVTMRDVRDRVHAQIALTPGLDWLLLTKRADVARAYYADPDLTRRVGRWVDSFLCGDFAHLIDNPPEPRPTVRVLDQPNRWLGVTVESQEWAAKRIPDLLKTPAAVRFISAEPLLGRVDLTRVRHALGGESFSVANVLKGDDGFGLNAARNRLDWVIAGGESGPGARPSHPDWFRDLRDQCEAAGVPFFFKQWGDWAGPGSDATAAGGWKASPSQSAFVHEDGRWATLADPGRELAGSSLMLRYGKKAAGNLLDGRQWLQTPTR